MTEYKKRKTKPKKSTSVTARGSKMAKDRKGLEPTRAIDNDMVYTVVQVAEILQLELRKVRAMLVRKELIGKKTSHKSGGVWRILGSEVRVYMVGERILRGE